MAKKHSRNILIMFVVIGCLGCFIWSVNIAKASSSIGTIDSVYKYAKGVSSNNIKINFGLFKGSVNVLVTDTNITGFAWGENIGWINLSPDGGGVINNGQGVLSGLATSEFGGLINFKPANGGVTINSSGEFLGYAQSEKFGLISFNCLNNNSCAVDDFKVKTDWRPISIRKNETSYVPPAIVVPTVPPTTSPISKTTEPKIENKKPLPPPLPIGDIGQYEGGGDVIKYNEKQPNSDGGIKYTLLSDDPSTTTGNEQKITEEKLFSDNIISNIAQKTKKISSAIQEKSIEIKKEAVIISNTPAVDISTKTVTTVGVAGGGTAVFSSLAGSTLSFSDLFLNFFRFWSLFLSAIGLRKKSRPWGTVYDSVTKQPLDPAYVVLQDKENREIATAITDLDGRFGFLVPVGAYKIYVRKNNYSFPSKKLFGKESDELYENLYFGEYLDFKKDKLIIKNIPMDPEKFDWNEFTKRNKKLLKFNSPYAHLFAKISNILFYFGFGLAFLLLVINGFNFYNVAIMILYLTLFSLRMFGVKPKSYGTITEHATGFPLSFAVIRVFAKSSKKEIFHRVSDKYGHYYCLLPKGEYYVTIEKKNNNESYSNIYTSEVFIVKKGILNKDFRV